MIRYVMFYSKVFFLCLGYTCGIVLHFKVICFDLKLIYQYFVFIYSECYDSHAHS